MSDGPKAIHVDEFLPHSPAKVWRALTDSEMIARWLMPNDFKLEVGHTFTFQGPSLPQAGFGGTGHSEVLGFEPERMLKIAWNAAPSDASGLRSTVTFTLRPEGTGTRVFLAHEGFAPDDPYQAVSRRLMGSGWPGVLARLGEVSGGLVSGER